MVSFAMRRASLLAALVLLLGLAVMPVSAQCTPASGTSADESFDCASDDPDGLFVGSGSDTVTVGIDNAGTPDTVTLGGTFASIYSTGGEVYLIVFAGDTLNTGDHAVLVDGNGRILARGIVNSDSSGFIVTGDGDIEFGDSAGNDYDPNSHLTADDVAMWVGGNGTITNYGEVDAGTAGLLIGNLENLGSIFTGDLDEMTAGTINNYGDVDGGLFGAAVIGTGTINNYASGVIEGDIASVAAIGDNFEINNYGVIEEGFIGALGYGSGTMNNYSGATVHADGVGMVFISKVDVDAIDLEALMNAGSEMEFIIGIGDLINSIETVGQMTINNEGYVDAPVGILLLGNGSINNTGEIDSDLLGIGGFGAIDITNGVGGSIHGGFIGAALIGEITVDTDFLESLFEADDVTDDELGILFYLAAALNAIQIGEGGTITNAGDIEDVAIGAIQLGNGNIINTEDGYIGADLVGTVLYGNGNLVNSGEIETSGVGMLLIGNITVDEEVFFDLDSVSDFLTEGDLFGPINFGGGTITNNGYVGGWSDVDPALVGIGAIGNVTVNNTYDGVVANSYVGVAAIGPVVRVNNSGYIDNTELGVIAAGDNVVVNNTVDGLIINSGVGVTVYGNGTVNNAGVIDTDGPAIMAYGDLTVNLREGSYTESSSAPEVVGDDNNQTVNIDSNVNINVIPTTDVVIALQGGQDRVNLRNDANVNGSISMGSGDDTVQIASGSRVEGVIDGGDEDNADVLIVGDETICGEAEGTAARIRSVRNLVSEINLDSDTFNFDGEDYTILDFEDGYSGVRDTRCVQFIEDGRINAYDLAASVAGYCNTLDGVNVWAIDSDGNGQVDFSVSGEQMRNALQEAVTGGQNVLVAQGARGSSLYALASNQYQMMRMQDDGKLYAYIFEPGRCGPSAVFTAE
jgi:hypothetical protein